MTQPWLVVVVALAAYRVTRLLVHDDLLAEARTAWWRRYPMTGTGPTDTPMWRHKVGDLVDCPYCAGFWVSGAMLGLAHLVGLAHWRLQHDLLLWWAVAGLQALLNAADYRLNG